MDRNSHSDNVNLIESYFQDFETKHQYDYILLHNSVNHLNEDACIRLQEDLECRKQYVNYFQKMKKLLREDGQIVITDCSNSNFFNTIGLKSPLAYSIEWDKHQHPKTWITLLKEAGFDSLNYSWTSQKQLRSVGKWILGNSLGAYFTNSHFVIHGSKIKPN